MTDPINLDDHREYAFFEAMCVKCLSRWIAVIRAKSLLKNLECKNCGPGHVICTGQDMFEK